MLNIVAKLSILDVDSGPGYTATYISVFSWNFWNKVLQF